MPVPAEEAPVLDAPDRLTDAVLLHKRLRSRLPINIGSRWPSVYWGMCRANSGIKFGVSRVVWSIAGFHGEFRRYHEDRIGTVGRIVARRHCLGLAGAGSGGAARLLFAKLFKRRNGGRHLGCHL